MTLEDMKIYFAQHGVVEDVHYTIGGRGDEIDGIEFIDGAWHTYFAERGAKDQYKRWQSEADAVAALMASAIAFAKSSGDWKE